MRSLFRKIKRKPRALFITISVAIHALVIFGLTVVFFPKNLQQDAINPISVTLVDGDKKQSVILIASEPMNTEPLFIEPLSIEPLVTEPVVTKTIIKKPLTVGLVATKPIPTKSSILKEIIGTPITPIIESQKTIQISNIESSQYSISSLTKQTRKKLTAAEVLPTDLLIDRLEKTRQLVLDLTANDIDKFDPNYIQAFRSDRQISTVNQDSTLTTYPIGHDLTKVVFAYSSGTKLCAEFTENDPLDAFSTGVWRIGLLRCN